MVSTLTDWNNHTVWYVISCVYLIKFNLVFESGYLVKETRDKLCYPSLWSKSTRIVVNLNSKWYYQKGFLKNSAKFTVHLQWLFSSHLEATWNTKRTDSSDLFVSA